jgi:putative oxidoreductase
MFISESAWEKWAPRLLSVIRILVALFYLQHGMSKWFAFPANPPQGFQVFSLLGLAGAIELIGSLLLLVGLFTRAAAFVMSGQMAVAYFMFRVSVSFFPIVNRGETEALFCFIFFMFFLVGGGPWSVDAMRGEQYRSPTPA